MTISYTDWERLNTKLDDIQETINYLIRIITTEEEEEEKKEDNEEPIQEIIEDEDKLYE